MTCNYILNELQQMSVDRMAKMNAAVLALSPGCGKTLCVLHFVKHILFKDNNDKCIFMLPKSARASFIKEISTRLNEPYYLITAETSKKYSYSDMAKYRYIFIENTLVNRYVEDLVSLANTNTCHLVIDEAHSLQNPNSVFTKAAWEVRCYCKRIYAMTATPLINDIEGLFNLYHFVFPRIFVSWFKFRSHFCITKERTIRMKNRNGAVIQRKLIEIIGYQNMPELNEILDKLTIKGCIHYNVNFEFLECDLDEESEKPYKLASSGLFDVLYHPEKLKQSNKKTKNEDGSTEEKVFAARLHDIQRVVDGCDSSVVDSNFISNKSKLLIKTIKEIIDRNESVLVYFEYKDSLEMIEKLLMDQQDDIGFKNIYRLTGAEKEDLRAKIESNLGLKEIVLCSQAASQSRNLQRANNIILWNLPWSCGRLIQVLGRICRCDTTYDKQNAYILAVSKTIDEYKVELFKKNISLIMSLLGNESMGTLEQCTYLDVSADDKSTLKRHLLWKRD